jgi:hypothetical protein
MVSAVHDPPVAVLAGGPEHGRRIGVTRPYPLYIRLETAAWGLMGFTRPEQPPRPRWWRSPLGWLRWQPWPDWPPASLPVSSQSCAYRHNGFLADDTPVYWYGGPDIAPPSDPNEVMRHLLARLAEVPPWERHSGRGHWEMGMEWYAAIRAVPAAVQLAAMPMDPRDPAPLLGAPVKITFGSPRLVARDTP